MDIRDGMLVAHYSRAGNTGRVARDLARRLHAQLESIIDPKDRSGLLGYVRSAVDAAQERVASIAPIKNRPDDYAITIIGTPVWCRNITPAVRTYIERTRDQLRDVALFVTSGDTDVQRIAPDIEVLIGKRLKASAGFSARELKDQALYQRKLDAFIAEIKAPTLNDSIPGCVEQIA